MEALLLSLLFLIGGVVGLGVALVVGLVVGLVYGSYYYDGSENGTRRNWPSLRRACIWNPARSYFSFRTQHLDPHLKRAAEGRSLIFACHPHGLFAISCFLAFAVNPKSRVRCGVHRLIFWVPLLRDFAVWMGAFDVSRVNVETALDEGASVAIVPGGAREMIPGSNPHRHRGFLRIAYAKRVPVVPVYFAGETDLFWTWSIFQQLREAFVDFMGYPFPSFFFGPLPRPLTAIAAKTAVDPEDYSSEENFVRAYDAQMTVLKQGTPSHNGGPLVATSIRTRPVGDTQ